MYVLRNSLQSSLNEFLGFYFKRYYFIVFPVTILIELLVWWLYSCTLVRNKHKMHQKTYLLVQFLSKKRLVCLHLTHLQPFSNWKFEYGTHKSIWKFEYGLNNLFGLYWVLHHNIVDGNANDGKGSHPKSQRNQST